VKPFFFLFLFLALPFKSCAQKTPNTMKFPVQKSEEDWKKQLSPEQYQVLRLKGTERPYSGALYKVDEPGTYVCGGCGNPLFDAETKFDAHCGWPSFYAPMNDDVVAEESDYSHGMIRTEVLCSKCGGHLGHVFPDGPAPTGLRYCINSVSMEFKPLNPAEPKK
jgi:peptide-methionine (R)-S-oxide reductase